MTIASKGSVHEPNPVETRTSLRIEPVETRTSPRIEPLVTLKQAADALGVPYFKFQRAARSGLIPTYFVYNSRRLVRLSEVIAVVNATRSGGAK